MGAVGHRGRRVYSVHNATVHLLAMPGGWVADRLTGILIAGID